MIKAIHYSNESLASRKNCKAYSNEYICVFILLIKIDA